MKATTIRVLLFEDKTQGSGWSAQCLDYDLAAQAKTLGDLIYEVHRVLVGHVVTSKELGMEPFANLGVAPPVYWQLFDRAKITLVRETAFPSEPAEIEVKIAECQPALQPA